MRVTIFVILFSIVSFGLNGQSVIDYQIKDNIKLANEYSMRFNNPSNFDDYNFPYRLAHIVKSRVLPGLTFENFDLNDSNLKAQVVTIWTMGDTSEIMDKSKVIKASIASFGDSTDLKVKIDYLLNFPNLVALELSMFSNFHIPQNLGKLTQLKVLEIFYEAGAYSNFNIYDTIINDNRKCCNNQESYNRIGFHFSLPEQIKKLSKLESLFIFSYSNFRISNSFINNFENLDYLVLTADTVTFINDEHLNTSNIKNLYLIKKHPQYKLGKYESYFYGHGKLTKPFYHSKSRFYKYSGLSYPNTLPEFVFQLNNSLQTLELGSYYLDKSEPRMQELKQLKRLNGSIFYKLRKLPKQVDSLEKLEELILFTRKPRFVRKHQLSRLSNLQNLFIKGRFYDKNAGRNPCFRNLYLFDCKRNLKALKHLNSSVTNLYLTSVPLKKTFKNIRNHHFQKIEVELVDLQHLRNKDIIQLNTDTLVIWYKPAVYNTIESDYPCKNIIMEEPDIKGIKWENVEYWQFQNNFFNTSVDSNRRRGFYFRWEKMIYRESNRRIKTIILKKGTWH